MLWLKTSDKYYYENLNEVKEKFEVDNVVILPKKKDIKKALISSEKTAFLVSRSMNPPKEFRSYFIVRKLKNTQGTLTKQEELFKVTQAESIMNNLGLKTIASSLKLKDMGGATGFTNWAKSTYSIMSQGRKIKPVFFLGLPGTGKSRGVASFAGEYDMPMVELNLTLIMESDDPIEQLHDVFEYLEDSQMKCVLRIDEIEQMLTIPALMGEMLTLLSELQSPEGYDLNGILFATANNISELSIKFPQFFRHGRWNEKFFFASPDEKTTISIMDYYSNLYDIKIEDLNAAKNTSYEREELLKMIYSDIEAKYKTSNIDVINNRCIYVPSELNYLFERISVASQLTPLTFDIIEEEMENVVPQQITAEDGIKEMFKDAQKQKFKQL